MAQKNPREDDSAEAVKLDLDNAKQRLNNIEAALLSPDQLGQLMANAVKNSSPLRKEMGGLIVELLGEHESRELFEGLINKVDRKAAWRCLKYLGAVLVGVAAVVACIFAIMAYFKP